MTREFDHSLIHVTQDLAVYYGPQLIGKLRMFGKWNGGRDTSYEGKQSGLNYTLRGAAIAEARAVIITGKS